MTDVTLAVNAGKILAGPELTPVENATLLVAGAHIAAVGPSSNIVVPNDVEIVESRDVTLVAGFIDAHVHIGFFDPADIVEGGVTTVRDLAWPAQDIFQIATASQDTSFRGPRVLATGPMLTVEGGYPTRAAWAPPGTGMVVSSPAEAASIVDGLRAQGACAIKVALNAEAGPTLPLETLSTITSAAHASALRVTAHIYGLDELIKALDAGVDELAHMLMSHEYIPDPVLDRMVRQEVTVVPTLSCRFGADRELAVENLARFVSRGGRVIYGTDLGNEGPRPGIDGLEISGMVDAEMSAMSIVRAATVDSAAYLGLPATGSIEAGAAADVIGIEGDPLDDPLACTRVVFVMRAGVVVKGP